MRREVEHSLPTELRTCTRKDESGACRSADVSMTSGVDAVVDKGGEGVS